MHRFEVTSASVPARGPPVVQRDAGGDIGLSATPLGLSLDQMRYDMIFREGFSITKTLDLAAAAVEVRVVVFDRASGKIGSLIVPVK